MPVSAASARREAARSGDGAPVPRHIGHVVGNVVYAIVAAALKVAFRYKVIGIEHLRKAAQGGCVLVSNHASYLDPAFLWVSARPGIWVRFMARENMFENAKGLAGFVISRVGAFPIKRDTADRTSIKRAAAMLKRGEVVGIFPEGTRRGRGTAKASLHGGAAFVARMGKAPLVPSAVRGAADVKRKGRRMRFPRIEVVYGEPIELSRFDFLPKEDRLEGATWYAMRECYALLYDVPASEVDMRGLFPESKDFTAAFAEQGGVRAQESEG